MPLCPLGAGPEPWGSGVSSLRVWGGTHNFYRNVLGIPRSGVEGWEKLQGSCLNVNGGTGMRVWHPRGIPCTPGGKCEPRTRNNPSITPKSSKKGPWGNMLRLLKSDLVSRWPTFKGHRAQSQKPLPGGESQGWHMWHMGRGRQPAFPPAGTKGNLCRSPPPHSWDSDSDSNPFQPPFSNNCTFSLGVDPPLTPSDLLEPRVVDCSRSQPPAS